MSDSSNQSPGSFSLTFHGRAGLTYREGDRSVFIDSEMEGGRFDYVIWADSIKTWTPPHDHELIGAEKRASIVENIREYFRSRGMKLDVATQN